MWKRWLVFAGTGHTAYLSKPIADTLQDRYAVQFPVETTVVAEENRFATTIFQRDFSSIRVVTDQAVNLAFGGCDNMGAEVPERVVLDECHTLEAFIPLSRAKVSEKHLNSVREKSSDTGRGFEDVRRIVETHKPLVVQIHSGASLF